MIVLLCCRTKVDASRGHSTSTYRYGDSIITAGLAHPSFRSVQPLSVTHGTLALPQPSLHGQCSSTAPVRFLHDSSSHCTVPLTEDSCSASGPLSARLYVDSPRWGMADALGVLAKPNGKVVLQTRCGRLAPCGAGAPLFPPLSIYFLIFSPFFTFLFLSLALPIFFFCPSLPFLPE